MSQIDVSKSTAFISTGFDGAIHAGKVVAYLSLTPSPSTDEGETGRRSHVQSHVVRKPTR